MHHIGTLHPASYRQTRQILCKIKIHCVSLVLPEISSSDSSPAVTHRSTDSLHSSASAFFFILWSFMPGTAGQLVFLSAKHIAYIHRPEQGGSHGHVLQHSNIPILKFLAEVGHTRSVEHCGSSAAMGLSHAVSLAMLDHDLNHVHSSNPSTKWPQCIGLMWWAWKQTVHLGNFGFISKQMKSFSKRNRNIKAFVMETVRHGLQTDQAEAIFKAIFCHKWGIFSLPTP